MRLVAPPSTTSRIFGSNFRTAVWPTPISRGAHPLTERSGVAHDYSVSDAPDDSYHAQWYAGVAAHFEQALRDGPSSPLVRENQAEAQTALMLMLGARKSSTSGGIAIKIAI